MIQLATKLHKHVNIIKIARTLHSVKEKDHENSNFVTIYKFPYIRPLAIVNRLKVLQTVLAGVSIPTTIALNLMNFVDLEAVQVVSALGITGCISLYSIGFFTMKFIGLIYYNEGKNIVKVAYIDFWGKRKDIEIPTADIIPKEEIPPSLIDGIYLKFRRYSTDEYFKYNLKYAHIVDREIFNRIL